MLKFYRQASGVFNAPIHGSTRNRIRPHAFPVLALLLAPGPWSVAHGQIEAPSAYEEMIESPTDVGGVAGEVDAEAAQVEAGDRAGLSRSAMGQIEEIVVQARKRDEFLEDTPVSITALGEELLREANITRIDQIENLVPNISINSGQTSVQIRIRGVGTAAAGVAFDPGVGMYIDGVYMPRAQSAIFDTLDVASVEVLRGPQGTLFGKNTIGGAVNITTRKPGEDLEAFQLVRVGNLGIVNTRSMINLPIRIGWFEDKLFTRLAFSSQNRSGYAENPFLGRDDLGQQDSLTFLGSVRFLPIDDLTIDVTGTWWESSGQGATGQCAITQETVIGRFQPGFYDACRESRPYRYSLDVDQSQRASNYGTWGTIRYDVGDAGWLEEISLKSITSWRQQRNSGALDLDATPFPMVWLTSTGGPDPRDGDPGTSEQIQQEFQINGSAWEGRAQFVGGFFAFWENAQRPAVTNVGVPNFESSTRNYLEIDNFTWAFFGQTTVEMTEWASLTAGLRYSSDGKKASQTNTSLLTDPPEITLQGAGDETFTAWSPMASIALSAPEDWLETASLDHFMGYFTYSKGFKGGGFNATVNPTAQGEGLAPFQPETLDNFEVGFKTIAFNRRVTLNLSLFYGKYDDIQQRVSETVFDENGDIEEILTLTLNAAEATTKGVEVEILTMPLPGLQVAGNVGLLDARYDSFPDAVSNLNGDIVDKSGQKIEDVPSVQAFLSAQYSFPFELDMSDLARGWLTARVQWSYRNESNALGPEVPQAESPARSNLGARFSYDFLDDRAQVALWGENLTDVRVPSGGVFSISNSVGVLTRAYTIPRTFGAELSYRF
jgi:iron complex outermembrane receptor protein